MGSSASASEAVVEPAQGRRAHQFQRPISFMVAGTSSIPTTVASSTTAMAMPRPTSLMVSSSPAAKPRNTITIRAAAEVTIRPVRCSPRATARSLSPVWSQASLIRESRNTS